MPSAQVPGLDAEGVLCSHATTCIIVLCQRAGEQVDSNAIAGLQFFSQVRVCHGGAVDGCGEVTVFVRLDVCPDACAIAFNAFELGLFLRGNSALVQLDGDNRTLTVQSLEAFTRGRSASGRPRSWGK